MGLRSKAKTAKIVEETNLYLSEPKKGLELCSNIISQGEPSFQAGLDKIDELLNDFMNISQADSNTTGVKTYKELLNIKKDVINILNFPKLENRYTVAVGGSFSAGKSSFFNKILGLSDVLPTDTNPTTSISSYIVNSNEDRFLALNNFDNIIELDKEAIQAISHAFKKSYNVSFSHILKLLSIEKKDLAYDNLVFLDTPGYSKSDSNDKENNTDENVAREHLRTTDFLIWLVDSQTPISATDMQFLKSLDLKHPILLVQNKADKRTPSDISKLVEQTRKNLETNGIAFYDVVAYSSSKGIEYTSDGNVIKNYLDIISSSNRGTKILKQVNDTFQTYIDYYNSQLVEYRATRAVLNKMIMEDAIDEEYLDEITTLSSKRIKQIKHIEGHKKSIEELQEKLNDTIANLLNASDINIIETSNRYIFDKELYSTQKQQQESDSFRFPALLQVKEYNDILKYKDLNSIEAKVYKVSSIGVFIKIDDIEGDLMISKSKIKKITGVSKIKEVFNVGDKVIVQITDNKKCVVIKG